MTKEELKGQIREIVREWWNCAEHVFPSILVDKLTDFAEPREKRIAELEERVWRQKKRMVEKTKKIAEFEAQIEKMKKYIKACWVEENLNDYSSYITNSSDEFRDLVKELNEEIRNGR